MKKFNLIKILFLVCFIPLVILSGCKKASNSNEGITSDNLEKSLAIDISQVKGSDNQFLLLDLDQKTIPKRPSNPNALPKSDPMHWYDIEYAGWKVEKTNIPESPKNGSIGKKVILIVHGDHPYVTAYRNGAEIAAEAYGIDLQIMSPNYDLNIQNQQIDQAINAKPDLIILIPLDAKAAVQQFRRINKAGIPLVASNLLPEADAMQYALTWSGPDDWGQFRMLAQTLSKELNNEGGVIYIQHIPGGSAYFARTYAPLTELAQIAPNIEVLDMQAPGFEAEKTKQVVSDMITRFGDKLKGIVASDDSAQAIGIVEAIKDAGREDIVVIAAGNSKVGMDYVKSGEIFAITYQSAEADGATSIKAAADFFNGKEVAPIYYLPKMVITQDNVDDYMPAQW